jgi:hypothetical protein
LDNFVFLFPRLLEDALQQLLTEIAQNLDGRMCETLVQRYLVFLNEGRRVHGDIDEIVKQMAAFGFDDPTSHQSYF